MSSSPLLPRAVLLAVAAASIGWSVRALVFPAAAGSDEHAGDEDPAAPEIAADKMLVRVTTAEVRVGDLPLVVSVPGVVRAAPAAERVLSSRASGRVLATFASNGQRVKRGELLLRFETAPLEAALAQTRFALAQAENQLAEFEGTGRDRQKIELEAAAKRAASARKLAEEQRARLEPLHADGLVSDKAVSEAEQALEQARTELEIAERAASSFQSSAAELQHATLVAARSSAEVSLHEAQVVLEEAELHAPSDGQITAFVARAGEKLEPGATLGVLLASERRVIAFSLTANAAARLSPGAKASWEAAGGARLTGTLASIAGAVDPASGLVEALVVPADGSPPEPPGLCVRGELEVQRLTQVALVPESALIRAHESEIVVLATPEGRARIAKVKLLGRHAGLAAIEGAVRAGERVIVDGGYNLPDGARIVESVSLSGPAPR